MCCEEEIRTAEMPCHHSKHTLNVCVCPSVLNWSVEIWESLNGQLKEYYEIVDEARPLSGFFPTHADFFTEMHL